MLARHCDSILYLKKSYGLEALNVNLLVRAFHKRYGFLLSLITHQCLFPTRKTLEQLLTDFPLLISIKINHSWIGIPYTIHGLIHFHLPTFMDIMIKNQTKIYQCSIKNQPKCQCSTKNQPKSTKTDPMGKYNIYTVRPERYGWDPGSPDPPRGYFQVMSARQQAGWDGESWALHSG